jgi:hypothetical protein
VDDTAIEAALARAHELQPLLPAKLADLPDREESTSRNPKARWWDWLDRIELAVSGEQHSWSKSKTRLAGVSPELSLQRSVPPPAVPEGPPSSGAWGDAYRKVTSSLPSAPGSRSTTAPQPTTPTPIVWEHEPASAGVAPSPPPGIRRATRVVAVAFEVVLALIVVVGLVALGVFLYRALRDAAQDVGLPGAGTALVTVPAFLALLLLVGWALIRFATSGPANNRLTVTLREHEGDLAVRAHGWRERRFPLPLRRAEVELSVPLLVGWDPKLPPEAAQIGLGPLAHATKPLDVAVDASLRLTGTCWERVLGVWLHPLGPIRVHRVQRGGSTRHYHDLTRRVLLAAPPRWLAGLAGAAARDGAWTVAGLGAPDGVQPGDVAVVVGAVVGEGAGSRIVVPGRADGDLVIDPDEVGDAAAIVVCGLPAVEAPDVPDTARLRRCAADVVLSGCPTAVVLPALPPELLRQSVDVLLEDLVRHRIAYPRQLEVEVQRVRELLARQHPAAAVEVTELRAR